MEHNFVLRKNCTMNKELQPSLDQLYDLLRSLISEGRMRAAVAVNFTTVETYWQLGREIVEEEQGGKDRAGYGKYILREMSNRLTAEFGGGFDESNLRYIRQFYKAFPIRDAPRHELTWTHYRILFRVENPLARSFYISETIECQWDTRLLKSSPPAPQNAGGPRYRLRRPSKRLAEVPLTSTAPGHS